MNKEREYQKHPAYGYVTPAEIEQLKMADHVKTAAMLKEFSRRTNRMIKKGKA